MIYFKDAQNARREAVITLHAMLKKEWGKKNKKVNGGHLGVRTLDRFPYTRVPGVRLRPLGQMSIVWKSETILFHTKIIT
jgi:hypothetical protein